MTHRDPDHYTLLQAVDDLTKPIHRHETQDIIRDGHTIGQQRIKLTHPPLLTQLENAIRASIGGTTTGATLASERSILDNDALMKFIQIDSQIRDWCRMLKITPTRDPAHNLRAWYTKNHANQRPNQPDTDSAHIKILGKWAALIRTKMDPWRERELDKTAACPTCGATSWWRDGHEYYRPLVVRYKATGADLIQQARVICRSCEAVFGVREAAYEIELTHNQTKDETA